MLEINLETDPIRDAWRSDIVAVLYEFARRASGQPIAITLGSERMILLQDRAHIRHVLTGNGDNYLKNFGGFEAVFGKSRFAADGDLWRSLQAISQPHISATRPADVVSAATRSFSTVATQLLEQGPGPIVIDPLINRAAADVIAAVTIGDHGLDIDETIADFRDLLRHGLKQTWNFGSLAAQFDPEETRRVDTARQRLSTAILAALERAGSRNESGLLKSIFEADVEGLDPVAEVASLLFAGFDTSATSIVWGLFLLANSPDLQDHLRSKVIEALGENEPTVEQLQQIPDLLAFRDEVLRIFPPVPMLGRIAIAGDRIGEIEIGAGQRLMLSIIGLHHDPRTFAHPAQVRLSRYDNGRLDGAQAQSHLPYGGGRRVCAGTRIANAELLTAYAVLLRRARFRLPDLEPLRFDWTVSLRRRGGQRLIVTPAE